jgi:hypothetical protein
VATLSFKDKITNLAGSLGTASDTILQQWILDGCYDVISKVKGQSNAQLDEMEFAQQSSGYAAAMDVSLSEVRKVVDVARNGYSCRRVSHHQRNFVDPSHALGANSIHKATTIDPIFYVLDNTLTVKPNPTASEQGYYSYIPEYSVSDFSATSSSINSFPKRHYEDVVLYASIKTVLHLLNNFNLDTDNIKIALDQAAAAVDKFISSDESIFGDEETFLTSSSQLTRVKNALDNAQNLVDDGASSMTSDAAKDVASYLADEDTELVSSALSIVSAEIQRAQTHLSEWSAIGDMRTKEASAALQEAAGYLNRDKTKYEWYMNTLQSLLQEYNSKFSQPQQTGGK